MECCIEKQTSFYFEWLYVKTGKTCIPVIFLQKTLPYKQIICKQTFLTYKSKAWMFNQKITRTSKQRGSDH